MSLSERRYWANQVSAIGCHADGIQALLLGVLIANIFVSLVTNTWNTGSYSYAEVVAFFAAYGYVYYAGAQHGRSLCLNCSMRFPLNLSEEAERRRGWLKVAHLHESRKSLAYLAVLFVIPAAEILDHGLAKAMLVTLFVVLYGGRQVLGKAKRVHNMLQPYCPFCRHGGGDGPDVEKAPSGPPGAELPVLPKPVRRLTTATPRARWPWGMP